jgi:tetratricopeptide (TPR) repeat protein
VEKISYYCQKCRAANESGEGNCWRCGTRLMLVVFPPSLRHEEIVTPTFYEDHLLERVSLLELRLVQVMEQLKMAYEFMQREATTLQKDHLFLQSFFETIQKVNPDFAQLLNEEFFELYNEKTSKLNKKNKKDRELKIILSEHNNKQGELFTHLVKEGISLFQENEEKQALRTLERASLLSPKNVPLFVFIAKKLFLADKFDTAKNYLEKAFDVEAQNLEVLLLLGSIYADEKDAEKARKLLSILANNPLTTTCVNLIWGMLAAFEENHAESLAAFKEALTTNDNPEIQYLVGCANFQIKKYEIGLDHLEKAVNKDKKFADAWFMQSVIYDLLGNKEKAKETMKIAFEQREAGAQCLEFMKNDKHPILKTALPFRHFNQPDTKILTKGSLRLRKFFRSQIFKSIE